MPAPWLKKIYTCKGKSHPLREDRDGSAIPCVWHGLAQSAPHLTGTGVHATLAQQKERMIIIWLQQTHCQSLLVTTTHYFTCTFPSEVMGAASLPAAIRGILIYRAPAKVVWEVASLQSSSHLIRQCQIPV